MKRKQKQNCCYENSAERVLSDLNKYNMLTLFISVETMSIVWFGGYDPRFFLILHVQIEPF